MTLTAKLLTRVVYLRSEYHRMVMENQGNPADTALEYEWYKRMRRLEDYLENRLER